MSRGGQDLALGDVCPGWQQQRGATRGALARAQGRLEPLLAQQAKALCQVSTPNLGPLPHPKKKKRHPQPGDNPPIPFQNSKPTPGPPNRTRVPPKNQPQHLIADQGVPVVYQ